MSDVKADTTGSAPNGTEGRTLSRARRQALSRGGKSGLAQTQSAKPAMRGPVQALVESAVRPASPSPAPAASSASSSPASSSNDEGRSNEDCGCTHTPESSTLEAVCALIEAEPSALGASASSVRQLCQTRRQERSSQGKSAQERRNKNGAARGNGRQPNPLSGRAAAQARRETLCLNGRGDSPACRPAGRVRAVLAAPAKVEEGNTLRGNLVTGTQVERSSKVTGIEAGSCRAVTGTEYIGAEQYGELCAATPAAAPAKVGSGSTSRGQRVSGTEVGRSVQVTGDERGACKSVTGNEYLSSEQFESFCGRQSTPSPAKVGVSSTYAGQRVSGTEVGRSSKVTGDEPGACLKLTGSQYYVPDQSGSVCQGSGVPHKVSVMSTVRDRPVTGTDLAASTVVTGSEYGACLSVTGTEYAGLQQYQACNREPVLTPEKVTVMRTWREQAVSGTTVEHNPKVTGDEYGGCQPISGTEYIGPGQYAASCAADRQSASREWIATPRGAAGASMTGVGTGTANKITGGARGEAQSLSGTAYSDDARPALSGTVGLSQHPLTRGPADRSKEIAASAATPVQGHFSVKTPARTAQASQLNRVTGTAYSAQGRITGPVNLAAGLVSGTPEFRYREDGFTAAPNVAPPNGHGESPPQMMKQRLAMPVSLSPNSLPQGEHPEGHKRDAGSLREIHVNRVTGGGRESGFAITGAAWQRDGSITGTEGSAATRRNPTQRGDPAQRGEQRSMGMQIPAVKEHLQVPPSKITGSSGNAATGSTITYSGGARG